MDKEILWYKVAQSGTKWHKVAQTAGWRGGQRPGRGGLCSIPVGCVMISKNLFFFLFFLSFLFVFKLSLQIFFVQFQPDRNTKWNRYESMCSAFDLAHIRLYYYHYMYFFLFLFLEMSFFFSFFL